MADGTLDSQLIVLFDNWPGVPRVIPDAPDGRFTAAATHNVATAAHKAGQKIAVWNTAAAGQEGMSTFIYLQILRTAAPASAAKQVVVPSSATEWWVVTNDPDQATAVIVEGSALAAVALSAMTTEYWGWFWCGGICPEAWVSGLGGNYGTESTVVAGMICTNNLTADSIGFGPVAADTEAACGYALTDDS